MIAFTVQASPDSLKRLRAMERQTPRVMRAAFGRAATTALRMLVSTVRKGGGQYGVSAFPSKTSFTREMERAEGRRGNWFGRIGVRPVLNRWVENGAQKIGFVSGVERWASALQESQRGEFSASQRARFRMDGVTDAPAYYSRPDRAIIDPFADYLRAGKYSDLVVGIAQKMLEQNNRR